MNKVQIIKSPGGEKLAVIPLSDFERLSEAAEDMADIQAYDAAKARIASGEDELVPAAITERYLDGENPVRVWREHRGLSIKALAEKAGISAPYLSQIEGGKREGKLTTMKALAKALDVPLDMVVE